ncbi:MAG TPA: glycosyltransferase family 4 protein [Afifellaceae bacterium]|nr:glycosyltransferase family 4 protein [Afifellaceae bacterium]
MPSRTLGIVHVVRAPIGGIFRHVADLARAQTAAGHRVGVICDSLTGGDFERRIIDELRPGLAWGVERIPMQRALGPRDLASSLAVAHSLAALGPDVVHCHGAKGGVFGRVAAALLRARGRRMAAFYAPHGGSLHYDSRSLAARVYFAVERSLELLTDGLVHVSQYEAATYCAKVGAPRCPASVVHNGLRPEEFEPVEPLAGAADFLFIGMLRDLKGVDVFLDALARLDGGAGAVIVGEGEPADEARYRRMADELGIAGRVCFRPPMPARQAFAMARTLVVPSRAESMPYIVLEAAAAGMPLIAARVGGIPEIFQGEADRLVPPADAVALAEAMRAALSEPHTAAKQAAVRRARLAERFSLSRMAGQVEAIYREALERRYPATQTGTRRAEIPS